MSRKNWTAEKLFERLLTNKTRKTYWDNILELRSRPPELVHTRAIRLCQSESEKAKEIGINLLAQSGLNPRYKPKKTIDQYFKLLDVPQTPKILSAIFSAIGHNTQHLKPRHVLKLVTFKNHNYSDVRFSLTSALSCQEDHNAIDTLIELSADSHPDVRNWATFDLGSQIETNTKQVVAALWNRLEDEDRDTRDEAIAGLAQRKDKSIKPILVKELEAIDKHGSQTLESIENFNDKDFIPLLETQIKVNRKTKKVNEKWLQDSLDNLRNNTYNC